MSRHQALEGAGPGSVEYQALQLVSSLEHYGVEWHWARDADAQRLAIGVGPEGIAVCKEDFALVNRWGAMECVVGGGCLVQSLFVCLFSPSMPLPRIRCLASLAHTDTDRQTDRQSEPCQKQHERRRTLYNLPKSASWIGVIELFR